MEEVLGNRELRGPAVQAHGEVVDLLDGVGVPEAGGLLRVALVVLLAGLVLLEDEPLHEADHGRSRLGVEDALEVPDGVVGRERPAAVPLDVAPEAERPRLEVGAGLPLLDETRARDVVHPRDGEVVAHLARRVRRLDPAVGVGALEILAPHAEPEGPALRQRLGLGGRQEPLPRDLARERVGRPRGHAEEGRRPQELAAVERALRELPLERGNVRMLSAVCHRRILPGAAWCGRSGHGDREAARPPMRRPGRSHTQRVGSTLVKAVRPSTRPRRRLVALTALAVPAHRRGHAGGGAWRGPRSSAAAVPPPRTTSPRLRPAVKGAQGGDVMKRFLVGLVAVLALGLGLVDGRATAAPRRARSPSASRRTSTPSIPTWALR